MSNNRQATRGAANMFGAITPEIEERIWAYVANPTEQGWDDIHGICVTDKMNRRTIWQAWIWTYGQSVPRTGPVVSDKGKQLKGWSRIPTSFEVLRSIQTAVQS